MNNNLRTDLIVEILPKNKTNKVDDIEIEKVIKQYDIPKDKKILGFIGRLSEQKGIIPFINEFARNISPFIHQNPSTIA